MAIIYIWAGQVYSVRLQKSLDFPQGMGHSKARFTQADDSAIISFPFIVLSFGGIGYLPQGSLKKKKTTRGDIQYWGLFTV